MVSLDITKLSDADAVVAHRVATSMWLSVANNTESTDEDVDLRARQCLALEDELKRRMRRVFKPVESSPPACVMPPRQKPLPVVLLGDDELQGIRIKV